MSERLYEVTEVSRVISVGYVRATSAAAAVEKLMNGEVTLLHGEATPAGGPKARRARVGYDPPA